MGEQWGPWVALSAEQVAHLPEASGVFEVANLVRNVVLIERAYGRLRDAVTQVLEIPGRLPLPAGGLYVRCLVTDQEAEALADRLQGFARAHAGALPLGNRSPRAQDTPPASRPVAA